MHWYIIIERVAGDRRSEEHHDRTDGTEQQAWDWARDTARGYGPWARVKSVTQRADAGGQ